MFIIVVYDVKGRKVTKVHKYLKTKLSWIQNSVFEGPITQSELVKLKSELKKKINLETDSVIIFRFNSKKYTNRTVIGIEKSKVTNII